MYKLLGSSPSHRHQSSDIETFLDSNKLLPTSLNPPSKRRAFIDAISQIPRLKTLQERLSNDIGRLTCLTGTLETQINAYRDFTEIEKQQILLNVKSTTSPLAIIILCENSTDLSSSPPFANAWQALIDCKNVNVLSTALKCPWLKDFLDTCQEKTLNRLVKRATVPQLTILGEEYPKEIKHNTDLGENAEFTLSPQREYYRKHQQVSVIPNDFVAYYTNSRTSTFNQQNYDRGKAAVAQGQHLMDQDRCESPATKLVQQILLNNPDKFRDILGYEPKISSLIRKNFTEILRVVINRNSLQGFTQLFHHFPEQMSRDCIELLLESSEDFLLKALEVEPVIRALSTNHRFLNRVVITVRASFDGLALILGYERTPRHKTHIQAIEKIFKAASKAPVLNFDDCEESNRDTIAKNWKNLFKLSVYADKKTTPAEKPISAHLIQALVRHCAWYTLLEADYNELMRYVPPTHSDKEMIQRDLHRLVTF